MAHRARIIGIVFVLMTGATVLTSTAPGTAQAPIEGGTTDWRTVSAGGTNTCGIRTTGRLYCWGLDVFGGVGNGGSETEVVAPVEVAGGHTDWTAVSAGGRHNCGRRATGRLYCWGADDAGQLGDGGTDTNQAVPVLVGGGATDWTSVSAGGDHTCGRRATGRLYCWGLDATGEVGDGAPFADQPSPVQVAGGATNWTMVSSGANHTCGRRATGRLYCWGTDSVGLLGNGAPVGDRAAPVQVAGGHTDWTSVSAGVSATCGRRATGRLYCWGFDGFGQVGNGNAGNAIRVAPVLVAGGHTNWTSVSVGGNHACGRRATGRLYCWGSDASGQVGNGEPPADVTAPVLVGGGATDWTAVTSGHGHTCGRQATRRIFCWGTGTNGRLGTGNAFGSSTPVEVAGP